MTRFGWLLVCVTLTVVSGASELPAQFGSRGDPAEGGFRPPGGFGPGSASPDRARLLTASYLSRYDENSNGFLDNNELPATLRSRLTTLDTSGDGRLDRQELERYFGGASSGPSSGTSSAAESVGSKAEDETVTIDGPLVVHPLKYASAVEVSASLGKLFTGPVPVRVSAHAGSNSLVIHAAAKELTRLKALVGQLDHAPKRVHVTVVLAELPPRVLKQAADAPSRIDASRLNGPAAEVLSYLRALQRAGDVSAWSEIQVRARENSSATLQLGQQKPTVTSVAGAARGGPPSVSIDYRSVGTVVTARPCVLASGDVLLDLKVEDSRLHTPEDGAQIGTTEVGAPIRLAETVVSALNVPLCLPPGQAVLASAEQTTSAARQSRLLIVVSAEVIGPAGGE